VNDVEHPERISLLNTAPRTITTRHHWETLPVGTIARVHFFEDPEDEAEQTMLVIRVEGDVTAAAGNYHLAGGRHWSGIWEYQQGDTALATEGLFDTPVQRPGTVDAIAAAKAEATLRTTERSGSPASPSHPITYAASSHGWVALQSLASES
jgi:hypothetical protein